VLFGFVRDLPLYSCAGNCDACGDAFNNSII